MVGFGLVWLVHMVCWVGVSWRVVFWIACCIVFWIRVVVSFWVVVWWGVGVLLSWGSWAIGMFRLVVVVWKEGLVLICFVRSCIVWFGVLVLVVIWVL